MSSLAHGNNTSEVEVTNISAHGIWLFAGNEEMFLSYNDFPWFKDKTVNDIIDVEEQSPGHFYWAKIDVDLTKEMIEHPERFPLKSKS
ncbi:MAG: DUF2442 domain-containing protein [Gammaproteobacteria bacterium]